VSRWTVEDGVALLGRGFTDDTIDAVLAALEELEADYPAWEASVTEDGYFRAVYAITRNGNPPRFDAASPLELRHKIARHYAQLVTPAQRPEGNTL
jgi:hypothetical protein